MTSDLTWTWRADLAGYELELLVELLRDPSLSGIQLRVKPSKNPDHPHRVRLHLPSMDPGDALDRIRALNEASIRQRIKSL